MNLLNIKNVCFILICLLILNYVAFGQAEINDTTISNDLVSLPINGYTGNWEGKKIIYTFQVSWASFELIDVIGNANSETLNQKIQYTYDWQNYTIKVTIPSIKSNCDGVLFNIIIRVLNYVDFYPTNEVFTITPKEIIVGDSVITLKEKTARVDLNYVPSNLTYIKDISFNYPNPFTHQTTILFSLPETNNVDIKIYNSLGSCIQIIPDKDNDYGNAFKYEIRNSQREVIKIAENNNFEKGLYSLYLIVNRWELSKGEYFLVIRVGDITKTIKMVVI